MSILKKYILFLVVAFILPFTACEKSDEPQPTPNPPATEHTLVCYFTGFDLNFFYYDNIAMIREAVRLLSLEDSALQNKIRVVYLFQQANKDKTTLFELEFSNGVCEAKEIRTYDLPERTEAETITYFLNEAITHAPARTYGLILGGHSRGWTPIDMSGSISQEHTQLQSLQTMLDHQLWVKDKEALITRFFGDPPKATNDYFSCIEIADLARGMEATGVKFEYTIYDACFMANVESLYELRNTTKFAIGSVCEIMGAGFPYKEVIPHLLGTGGKSFDLDSVCKAYKDYYELQYGYSGSASLVDMSELEALAQAFKQVRATGLRDDIQVTVFQRYDGLSKPLFVDLGEYVSLAATNEQAKADFMSQLEKSVVSRYTLNSYYSAWGTRGRYHISEDSYHGLSTSYPSEFYRDEYYQTAWYRDTM